MTDCIPADAVRELRDKLRAEARLIGTGNVRANIREHLADALDSLLAQARPCDHTNNRVVPQSEMNYEGLREALKHILTMNTDEPPGLDDDGLHFAALSPEEAISVMHSVARTALAEEEDG